MSPNDPTDSALAAIASILDNPERPPPAETARAVAEEMPVVGEEPPVEEEQHSIVEEKPLAPEMIEAAGYSKVGPGPMEQIRFRWTVRHQDGDYFVDETIGANSVPIVSGPMSSDAAVRLVDERESEARRRFELLKSEMIGRSAAANLVRKDSGEM